MLTDISNINNNFDLISISVAVFIVDFIVICIAKNTNLFGNVINTWYEKLGMTAVLIDVFIIIIGLIITRYVFYYFNLEFTPSMFIIIAVIIQLVHDILLYKLFIESSNEGDNTIIDLYKNYSIENGAKILLADSGMVIASALIAMYLKNFELHYTFGIFFLVIYLIPYVVYQNKLK